MGRLRWHNDVADVPLCGLLSLRASLPLRHFPPTRVMMRHRGSHTSRRPRRLRKPHRIPSLMVLPTSWTSVTKEWIDKNNEETRGEGTFAQGAVSTSGTAMRTSQPSARSQMPLKPSSFQCVEPYGCVPALPHSSAHWCTLLLLPLCPRHLCRLLHLYLSRQYYCHCLLR